MTALLGRSLLLQITLQGCAASENPVCGNTVGDDSKSIPSSWHVGQLHHALGAELLGLDDSFVGNASAATCQFLRGAMNNGRGLILARLGDESSWNVQAMHSLASCFGKMEHSPVDGSFEKLLDPADGRIHVFSKVPSARVFDDCAEKIYRGEPNSKPHEDAESWIWNRDIGQPSWHTDQSFRSLPARFSIMYCVQTPASSGDTLFAGGVAAYDSLERSLKHRISGLYANHSYATLLEYFESHPSCGDRNNSKEEPILDATQQAIHATIGAAMHPLVRRHASKPHARSLYLAPTAIAAVVELNHPTIPIPNAMSLVDDLAHHMTSPRFVYRHRWKPGDLMIWDNFATMHTATKLSNEIVEERIMWRSTVL